MTRKLANGTLLRERPFPVTVSVTTRVPAKYVLVDTETGEVWQIAKKHGYHWLPATQEAHERALRTIYRELTPEGPGFDNADDLIAHLKERCGG